MAVAVKTVNIFRQMFWQFVRRYSETCSWSTRVIQHGSYFRILRIYTQTDGTIPYPMMKTLILRQRVERQVTRAVNYLVEFLIFVGW